MNASPHNCTITPLTNTTTMAAPSRLVGRAGSLWVDRIMMALTETTVETSSDR